MRYEDAKEAHRRIYFYKEYQTPSGMEDISSRVLGGAAAFQAFLSVSSFVRVKKRAVLIDGIRTESGTRSITASTTKDHLKRTERGSSVSPSENVSPITWME